VNDPVPPNNEGKALATVTAKTRLDAFADAQFRRAQEDYPTQILHTPFADIKQESVEWEWPGYLPVGKGTTIAGDPGLGKSLLTLDLAARLSAGTPMPLSDSARTAGDVLILSAEDDPGDTIGPRLSAAGANLERVHYVSGVRFMDDAGALKNRIFSLKQDMATLEYALLDLPKCRLVIIDPVTAYLDGVDAHSNAEVRGVLAPVAEFAARYRVAVILVAHLNKGTTSALYRVSGSLAFVAAARVVHLISRDPDAPKTRRLMLPCKNNLAPDGGTLAYTVVADKGTARIEWDSKPLEITADEALARRDPADESERSREGDARAWLADTLKQGPVLVNDLKMAARDAGLSWRVVERAKASMAAAAVKSGKSGGWSWRLAQGEIL
jgi:putative DNA primase/helicase